MSWEGLVSIFDSLIGSELHDLPKYPQVIGGTTAKWIDGEGNEHELDSLEALQTPYSEKQTGRITVSSRTGDGEAMFDYWPGAPRPRIRATLTANVDEVQARLSEITQVFPDPFEGAVIFLSWGGDPSRSIAQVLHRMFEARFPSADVFFSPESIDIGDDPMKELFEKHLLQAQALIAVITVDAANRPWVIWEIASTWAREKLVAPLFVGMSPGEVQGPLALKIQGAQITDRAMVDRTLVRVAGQIGASEPQPLSDEEWGELMATVVASPA